MLGEVMFIIVGLLVLGVAFLMSEYLEDEDK